MLARVRGSRARLGTRRGAGCRTRGPTSSSFLWSQQNLVFMLVTVASSGRLRSFQGLVADVDAELVARETSAPLPSGLAEELEAARSTIAAKLSKGMAPAEPQASRQRTGSGDGAAATKAGKRTPASGVAGSSSNSRGKRQGPRPGGTPAAPDAAGKQQRRPKQVKAEEKDVKGKPRGPKPEGKQKRESKERQTKAPEPEAMTAESTV